MGHWLTRLKGLKRYPSLAAGMIIVIIFIAVSVYAVIAIPYSEAVRLWRGGPGQWETIPKNARPVWFDLFTRDRLSRTIVIDFDDEMKTEEQIGEGMKRVEIVLPFRYDYDSFPNELNLFTRTTSVTRATVSWEMPDGRTVILEENRSLRRGEQTYYISQDTNLLNRLEGMAPHRGLFVAPEEKERPLRGDYQLVVQAELLAADELDAKLVVYGEIYGTGGTDHRRRDLMVALLWGAPIGLMFGVLAAVGTQVSTFVLAGIGTWLGGKTDRVFQWLTQVNIILPVLPFLIMVGHFYSRSIWTMLGLVIALNVFSASMFTYRAMFLQAKEAPYIEASQAYGAGNSRIIFRYLLPRIVPTLLPQFVLVIPTFVFLEATLAVLGLGDPSLPTWGKLMSDAYTQGSLYKGLYYWIVQPAFLLMVMGVGFALVGYSLDRIFNPRLRTM